MNISHVLVATAGVILILASAFAQQTILSYHFLAKEKEIVISALKNSPKKINITWKRPDGSIFFSREFNVAPGEKVIISPVKE